MDALGGIALGVGFVAFIFALMAISKSDSANARADLATARAEQALAKAREAEGKIGHLVWPHNWPRGWDEQIKRLAAEEFVRLKNPPEYPPHRVIVVGDETKRKP